MVIHDPECPYWDQAPSTKVSSLNVISVILYAVQCLEQFLTLMRAVVLSYNKVVKFRCPISLAKLCPKEIFERASLLIIKNVSSEVIFIFSFLSNLQFVYSTARASLLRRGLVFEGQHNYGKTTADRPSISVDQGYNVLQNRLLPSFMTERMEESKAFCAVRPISFLWDKLIRAWHLSHNMLKQISK